MKLPFDEFIRASTPKIYPLPASLQACMLCSKQCMQCWGLHSTQQYNQVGPTTLQARRDSTSFQLRSSFAWLSSCSAIAAASFCPRQFFELDLHFIFCKTSDLTKNPTQRVLNIRARLWKPSKHTPCPSKATKSAIEPSSTQFYNIVGLGPSQPFYRQPQQCSSD